MNPITTQMGAHRGLWWAYGFVLCSQEEAVGDERIA